MRTSRASVVAAMLVFLSSARLANADGPATLRIPIAEGPVRAFALVDSQGKRFEPEQLRGKVWVVHFFFTTCMGNCTKTTPLMKRLQDAFRDHPHLALVSISVNPENDSAQVLREFAAGLGAREGQWFFLTGAEKQVHAVAQEAFFQTAMRAKKELRLFGIVVEAPPDPGFEFDHTFNLMLVDHEGNHAGYLDATEGEGFEPLVERLKELLRRRMAEREPLRFWLPRVNASLNGLCALFLLAGYLAIRQRKEALHITLMLLALGVSAIFLCSYLYYHFVVLGGRPTSFPGEGLVRGVYLAILLSHTILAAAVAPMAIWTALLGLKDNRTRHVRLARWTFPLWLYVSVTGVVVYWMLYHLYPPY